MDSWKILLVEDNEDDYILTRAMLNDTRPGEYDIRWARDHAEGLRLLEELGEPDVILVDYLLGAVNGVDFVREARRQNYRAPAILLTGYTSSQATEAAVDVGIVDYVDKNTLSGPLLERSIRFTLERRRLISRLEEANQALEQRVAERTRDLEDTNQALNEANLQIEKLLASTHMHIAYLDNELRFIRVNHRYAEANNQPESYFPGKYHFDLFPNPEYEAIFRQVIETGKEYITYARPSNYPERPDHNVTYWDWHLIPLCEMDGSVSGLTVSLMDVTEQQRDRQALGYQAYLLENVSDAIIATDAEMRLSAWNRAAEKIFGWQRGAVMGKHVFEVLDTQFNGFEREAVMAVVREQGIFEGEGLEQHRDGRRIAVEIRITRLLDPHGSPAGFIVIQRDISRRLAIQAEADQVRRRLEAQAEMSHLLGGTSLDYQKMLDITAQRASELVGDACVVTRITPEGRIQPVAYHHTDPEGLAYMRENLDSMTMRLGEGVVGKVAQTGVPALVAEVSPHTTQTFLTASQTYAERFGVHSLLVVPIKANDQVIGTLGLSRDHPGNPYTSDDELFLEAVAGRAGLWIANAELFAEARRELAERKRVQAELNEIQTRLMEGIEEERMTLARELHDGPIQDLYGLEYQLHGLTDAFDAAAGGEETLEAMRASIQSVIDSLRGVTMELRPPVLSRLGLGAAIRSHCDTVHKASPNLDIHVELDSEKEQPISQRTRLALFRIAQVALTNVVRHARASQVWVRLKIQPEQILLEVEDDGAGFQVPGRWIEMARDGHLGLLGAKERVDALNGRIEVNSAPGKGTKIRVIVPVDAAEMAEIKSAG